MTGDNIRPAAIVHKGSAIFDSINAGATSVAAIGKATGFPATTIVRVLSILVHDDDLVEARLARGELRLSVKSGHNPDEVG